MFIDVQAILRVAGEILAEGTKSHEVRKVSTGRASDEKREALTAARVKLAHTAKDSVVKT
jgi:hypothetical protein